MLDRPRTPTLPLGHQYTTACRSSGRLALPDLRRLITHKKCRTESHEHERSCERENCFGEARDGSRVDYTEHERLQVKIRARDCQNRLGKPSRGVKYELTPRICPRAVSMLRPPKSAPISGVPCRERWRMQIARLCSAGLLPAARAEMLVIPVKVRGDEERCNATRECDKISRKREPRTIQRSKVMQRVSCTRAELEDNSEREVEGAWEDGLKVDIRTGDES